MNRKAPERIEVPNDIDMKMLKKAIWLNNNIFQSEKKPYIEQIIYNADEPGIVYYHPATTSTILEMDARFGVACSIVYSAIIMDKGITADDMVRLNNIYKELKEEYGC